MRKLIIAIALLLAATAAFSQNAIPTPDEYLGYTLGDRFTPWDRIVDYFNELTRRSPLITVQKIGETYEHRPLMIAVITSQANRAKLDAIRHDVASLANGVQKKAAELLQLKPSTLNEMMKRLSIHTKSGAPIEDEMTVAE